MVNIPSGVTTINSYAFESCQSLTSVNISSSVTSIGWGAFYDDTNLTVSRPAAKTDWTASYLGCKAVTTY